LGLGGKSPATIYFLHIIVQATNARAEDKIIEKFY